jgi:hypothetical protein
MKTAPEGAVLVCSRDPVAIADLGCRQVRCRVTTGNVSIVDVCLNPRGESSVGQAADAGLMPNPSPIRTAGPAPEMYLGAGGYLVDFLSITRVNDGSV